MKRNGRIFRGRRRSSRQGNDLAYGAGKPLRGGLSWSFIRDPYIRWRRNDLARRAQRSLLNALNLMESMVNQIGEPTPQMVCQSGALSPVLLHLARALDETLKSARADCVQLNLNDERLLYHINIQLNYIGLVLAKCIAIHDMMPDRYHNFANDAIHYDLVLVLDYLGEMKQRTEQLLDRYEEIVQATYPLVRLRQRNRLR